MKEYFRQQKITLRYWPLSIIPKILFFAMIVIIPSCQWALIMIGAAFSFGFKYTNEIEFLLPLTDDEIKKAWISRCNMIWLRYLILSAIGFTLAFHIPQLKAMGGHFITNLYIFASFFLFQMVMCYSILLEKAITQGQTKKKNDLYTYLFNTLPAIVYFVYGWAGMNLSKSSLIVLGNPMIHALVLTVAAILLVIYSVRIYRNWTLTDYTAVGKV